jgi:hypothetical protein
MLEAQYIPESLMWGAYIFPTHQKCPIREQGKYALSVCSDLFLEGFEMVLQ